MKSALRGIAAGLLILGVVYFVSRYGDAMKDTLLHIPEIIFEGYRPATMTPEFARDFAMWLGTVVVLGIVVMPDRDKKK